MPWLVNMFSVSGETVYVLMGLCIAGCNAHTGIECFVAHINTESALCPEM